MVSSLGGDFQKIQKLVFKADLGLFRTKQKPPGFWVAGLLLTRFGGVESKCKSHPSIQVA